MTKWTKKLLKKLLPARKKVSYHGGHVPKERPLTGKLGYTSKNGTWIEPEAFRKFIEHGEEDVVVDKQWMICELQALRSTVNAAMGSQNTLMERVNRMENVVFPKGAFAKGLNDIVQDLSDDLHNNLPDEVMRPVAERLKDYEEALDKAINLVGKVVEENKQLRDKLDKLEDEIRAMPTIPSITPPSTPTVPIQPINIRPTPYFPNQPWMVGPTLTTAIKEEYL